MYFETHAHYDDSAFDTDRDLLLPSLYELGIQTVIDPGCDVASTKRAMYLAEKYPFVYFAAGIHPEELRTLTENSMGEIRTMAKHEKCVAIGEIGLDYYWDDTQKEEQKQLFHQQLKLALELNKPVIIHDREAHGDCYQIVCEYPSLRGVFHCYSGSAEMAQELLKRGWYLGFDGPITYKNARKNIETLTICPMERILIETDSPYLSPVPKRGKRNDSSNLQYVCEKIAEVKGITAEAVASITAHNAEALFFTKR